MNELGGHSGAASVKDKVSAAEWAMRRAVLGSARAISGL